ncbi:MAG: ABC transporter permease [Lachnospiraceae bacterium]|nr:ABC transporter permease [Lachnospiraceae bacterium]
MKKSNNIYSMDGLGQVFSFTIGQTFKNQAYRVSFIIFVLMLILMGPINYLGAGAGVNAAKKADGLYGEDAGISSIYVVNETRVPFAAAEMDLEETAFASAAVKQADEFPALAADELGIKLSRQTVDDETCFMIDLVTGKDAEITEGVVSALGDYLTERLALARRADAELTDEQIEILSKGMESGDVMSDADYITKIDSSYTNSQVMSISMLYSIIVMILGSLTASYVISSVMEEKTSKLVENLLVSVRPLALVFGKILAVMTYVGLMIVLGIGGSFISNKIAAAMSGSEIVQHVGGMLDFSRLFSMGPAKSILIIVCMLLTYLQFSILAGVLGSACVKPEDAQSAIGTVTMINMTCYMLGIVLPNVENPMVYTVASMIPVVSGYLAPVGLIVGRVPLWAFLIGMALNIVVIMLLFRLCAKTYRKLIVNDSKRLKLFEIIRLSAGKEDLPGGKSLKRLKAGAGSPELRSGAGREEK